MCLQVFVCPFFQFYPNEKSESDLTENVVFLQKNTSDLYIDLTTFPKNSQSMILIRSFQLMVQNLGLFTSFFDFYLILTTKCGDTKSNLFNFRKTLFHIRSTHKDIQCLTFLRSLYDIVEKALCSQDFAAEILKILQKNRVGAIVSLITHKLKHQDLSVSKKSCLYQPYKVACKKQKNSVGKILRKLRKPAKFHFFFRFFDF